VNNHAGALDPVSRGMAAAGQAAELTFLRLILGWAGNQQLRHDLLLG
jgi:hypothetical protein